MANWSESINAISNSICCCSPTINFHALTLVKRHKMHIIPMQQHIQRTIAQRQKERYAEQSNYYYLWLRHTKQMQTHCHVLILIPTHCKYSFNEQSVIPSDQQCASLSHSTGCFRFQTVCNATTPVQTSRSLPTTTVVIIQ